MLHMVRSEIIFDPQMKLMRPGILAELCPGQWMTCILSRPAFF